MNIKWYKLFDSRQEACAILKTNIPTKIRLDDLIGVVVKDAHNQFYAFDDRCPHDGASLGNGEIKNGQIECPWHHYRFQIITGKTHNACPDLRLFRIEDRDGFYIGVPI